MILMDDSRLCMQLTYISGLHYFFGKGYVVL